MLVTKDAPSSKFSGVWRLGGGQLGCTSDFKGMLFIFKSDPLNPASTSVAGSFSFDFSEKRLDPRMPASGQSASTFLLSSNTHFDLWIAIRQTRPPFTGSRVQANFLCRQF